MHTLSTGSALVLVGALAWLTGSARAGDGLSVASIERSGAVDFEKEILPFLKRNCLACHNATDAEADVVLETPQTIATARDGESIVIPGEAAESLLFQVAAHLEEPHMPPEDNDRGAKNLTPKELALLKLWIDGGAKGEVSRRAVEVEWFPLPAGVHPVFAIDLSPDGRFLAGSRANQIFMYDLAGGETYERLTDRALVEGGVYDRPGVAHLDQVQALAFAPNGRVLASGGFRCLKLWERAAHEPGRTVELGADGAVAFAVNDAGDEFAGGTMEGEVHVWKEGATAAVLRLAGHTGRVTHLEFARGGQSLLSASEDQTAILSDLRTGEQLLRLEASTPLGAATFLTGAAAIAAAGGDGKVHIWKVEEPNVGDGAAAVFKGTPAAPLAAHQGAVTSLAVVRAAPHQLLSAGADGVVVHWDVAAQKELRRLKHGAPVRAVAVRPDGKVAVSCGQDGALRLWSLADGKEVAEHRGAAPALQEQTSRAQKDQLAKRVLETARKRLADADKAAKKAAEEAKKAAEALAAAAQALEEKRTVAGEEKDEKKAEEAKKTVAAAEKARQDAATKKEDADLELGRAGKELELATARLEAAEAAQAAARSALGEAEKLWKESVVPLRAVAFSGDGRRLAAVDERGIVHVASGEGAPLATIDAGETVEHVAFARSGGVLAVDAAGRAVEWSVEPSWTLAAKIDAAAPGELSPFSDRVTAVAFSPDGDLIVTGDGEPSRSGNLKLWRVADQSLVWAVDDAHSDTISDLEFSCDGKLIATAGTDKFVRVFSAADGKLERSFEGHTSHVLGVSWQADGEVIASCGADNIVKVWDLEKGEQRRTIRGYGKQVTAIRFLAIGEETVSCSGDRSVRRHRVTDGRQVRTFGGAGEFLHSLTVTPDGSLVAAGDQSGVIRVWNANDGKQLLLLEPPQAE